MSSFLYYLLIVIKGTLLFSIEYDNIDNNISGSLNVINTL